MTLNQLTVKLDNLLKLFEKLNEMLAKTDKGGPGSGCSGPNCGRPEHGHGDKPKPRSGVRPSEVNPSRNEIVYTEEPSSDGRPRSGVRPTKPRKA